MGFPTVLHPQGTEGSLDRSLLNRGKESCMQTDGSGAHRYNRSIQMIESPSKESFFQLNVVTQMYEGEEDCLVLNVYTRNVEKEASFL